MDVWQIGILTYELAVGSPPFETDDYEETYQRILRDEVEFPEHVSYELRRFVGKLLQKRA